MRLRGKTTGLTIPKTKGTITKYFSNTITTRMSEMEGEGGGEDRKRKCEASMHDMEEKIRPLKKLKPSGTPENYRGEAKSTAWVEPEL